MARLMFVTGSLRYGGAERHSITLVNRLAERGHQCHAVYVKSGAEQLERIRLRGGAGVRCLDAASYFDVAALRRFAAPHRPHQAGGDRRGESVRADVRHAGPAPFAPPRVRSRSRSIPTGCSG